MAITHHCLLHLQCGVFRYRQVCQYRRANRRTARLTEQQRRLRINVDEHFFHRHLLRPMLRDHLAQGIQDYFQPFR